MKLLTIILIVWGVSTLDADEARIRRLSPNDSSDNAKALEAQNKALQRLLQNQRRANRLESELHSQVKKEAPRPFIWERKDPILTGKVYRGILLNSIVSTNLASPVLVRVRPGQGLPHGTKFACQGVSQNKRIHTQCQRMILEGRELQVSAQLLNTDGTAGLVGEIEDGKEDMIFASLASNFSQGMLSAAQNRVSTPYGSHIDSTLRNQIMQGLIQSGGTASDIFLEEMRNITPVVTVQAGEEVLVYFQEKVDEY